MKEKIIVVCPGRGSYTKESIGLLSQYQNPELHAYWQRMDERRLQDQLPSLSSIDTPPFRPQFHTLGEHASTLIFTGALMDFYSIDFNRFEVVAVLGNSMGWYLALSCAYALNEEHSYQLVQTMGGMMRERIIGGQIIYSLVDEQWQMQSKRLDFVHELLADINTRKGHEAYISIYLGGYLVLAGNEMALNALLKELPPVENYPFKLVNHAAFHTPLLQETSSRAFTQIPRKYFRSPLFPLVDGRGKIWTPYGTDVEELYQYTLGHQVVAPYDFTLSLEVALKEFAPKRVVLLGPGATLGGSIGQVLVKNRWQQMASKKDFQERQLQDPFLLAMGIKEQRQHLI